MCDFLLDIKQDSRSISFHPHYEKLGPLFFTSLCTAVRHAMNAYKRLFELKILNITKGMKKTELIFSLLLGTKGLKQLAPQKSNAQTHEKNNESSHNLNKS